jgi:hypothetical protein
MYDITVLPLNAVPVAKIQYNNFIKNNEKDIIKKITDWELRDESSRAPLVSNTYRLFEEYNLYDLKSRFDECVHMYATKVLGVDVGFKNIGSWVTRNTINTFHRKHTHPNTVISVVTYFDDNMEAEELLPGIIFSSSGLNNIFKPFTLDIEDKIKESNIFNSRSHSVKPCEGAVIIFPGYIPHQSQVNNTESRYCVAANYFFCDSFGSSLNKNYVEIR